MPFAATAKFPGAVAQVSDLLNWKNIVPTNPDPTLASGIGASDTTITLATGTGSYLPTDNFVVSIDNEIIFISSRSTDTLTVGTRGYEGTTAASHSTGAAVESRVTALSHNQLAAEVNAIETFLGATSTASVAARVFNSSSISVANNTAVVLTFDSERYNYGGVHSVGTNPSRLTAPVAGIYSVTGHVHWEGTLNGTVETHIRLNGTTDIGDTSHNSANNASALYQNVHAEWYFNVNDYVELVAFQVTGAGATIDATGDLSPEFEMTLIPMVASGTNLARQASPVGGRKGDGSTGNVTNSGSLTYGGGVCSLSFWFKPNATPVNETTPTVAVAIEGSSSYGFAPIWALSWNVEGAGFPALLSFTFYYGPGASYESGGIQIPSSYWPAMLGVWNHIAATVDASGNYSAWLNGVQVVTQKPTGWSGYGPPATSVGSITALGNHNSTQSSSTVGDFSPDSVAEIAFWNCTLSGTDITNLANGYKASEVETASLVVYWKFMGQSPEPDESGNGISGTVTDTTSVPGPSIRVS